MSTNKISAIIAAGGSGSRAGFDVNKLLVQTAGGCPLQRSVKLFDIPQVDEIIVAVSQKDEQQARAVLKDIQKPLIFTRGGDSRFLSVKNALKSVTGDIVLIHDGARCNTPLSVILGCIESTVTFGSGVCAIPSTDTVCLADDGSICESLNRQRVYALQTPQGFLTEKIKLAYASAEGDFTDDSSVYLKYIGKPRLTAGDKSNIKLTFREDFMEQTEYFTGTGFDVHALKIGRKLILGGVELPFEKGLDGHSDADVLTHAICDALLSAAGLRDIGYYFPDSDPKYKGICSLLLLEEVVSLLKESGFRVQNVSAVIIAQRPKILPFIDQIKHNLSKVMHISTERLGITATTTEGLGFTGRGEGIAVNATVSIFKGFVFR